MFQRERCFYLPYHLETHSAWTDAATSSTPHNDIFQSARYNTICGSRDFPPSAYRGVCLGDGKTCKTQNHQVLLNPLCRNEHWKWQFMTILDKVQHTVFHKFFHNPFHQLFQKTMNQPDCQLGSAGLWGPFGTARPRGLRTAHWIHHLLHGVCHGSFPRIYHLRW